MEPLTAWVGGNQFVNNQVISKLDSFINVIISADVNIFLKAYLKNCEV